MLVRDFGPFHCDVTKGDGEEEDCEMGRRPLEKERIRDLERGHGVCVYAWSWRAVTSF